MLDLTNSQFIPANKLNAFEKSDQILISCKHKNFDSKFPSRKNKKWEIYSREKEMNKKLLQNFICINVFVENILENTFHQENCMKNVVFILIHFYQELSKS